jgi:hypothetical protein
MSLHILLHKRVGVITLMLRTSGHDCTDVYVHMNMISYVYIHMCTYTYYHDMFTCTYKFGHHGAYFYIHAWA